MKAKRLLPLFGVIAIVGLIAAARPIGRVFAVDQVESADDDGEEDDGDDDDVKRTQVTGPEGYSWTVQNAGRRHSLEIRDGVYRFEVRPHDHWPRDGRKTERNRSEISGLTVPSQGRSTVSYEVMVEDADFSAKGVQHVIGQRHGKADLADKRGEHPSVAFRIMPGGRPSLTVSGSSEQPLRKIPKSRYPWTGEAELFRQGAWHAIKIDSYSGDMGWVDLWLDGALMRSHPHDLHTYSGPFGYVNARDDYWKFGDYVARGTKRKIIIRVRNIRRTIGDPPAAQTPPTGAPILGAPPVPAATDGLTALRPPG